MLLDRSHAGPVGLDAAGDLDLARRTAGLDAEGDGREVITTPLTSDGPVPPNVSMPRCTTSRPIGWLI